MKSGRKRVKLCIDEGFYFGYKSGTCRIPALNYMIVDLLLACTVFKTFFLCYLSRVSFVKAAYSALLYSMRKTFEE